MNDDTPTPSDGEYTEITVSLTAIVKGDPKYIIDEIQRAVKTALLQAKEESEAETKFLVINEQLETHINQTGSKALELVNKDVIEVTESGGDVQSLNKTETDKPVERALKWYNHVNRFFGRAKRISGNVIGLFKFEIDLYKPGKRDK